MPKKIFFQESGRPEVFNKSLESCKGYRAGQVLRGGLACCCFGNHWRTEGSHRGPQLSLLCLQLFLKWPYLIPGLILCILWLGYEGTCLSEGKDLVLPFEKQPKEEHNERSAEYKVLGRHDRSSGHQPYTHNSHL